MCLQPDLWNRDGHRQTRRVLAEMLHLDSLTRIQGRQKWVKMLTELVIRCGRVRRSQPIVAAQKQFMAPKLEPSIQHRVSLKTLACRQSTVPDGSQTVLNTLDGALAGMCLASTAVQESEPRIREVHGVVRVVRNLAQPWPLAGRGGNPPRQ